MRTDLEQVSDLLGAITRVFDSQRFINGPEIDALERPDAGDALDALAVGDARQKELEREKELERQKELEREKSFRELLTGALVGVVGSTNADWTKTAAQVFLVQRHWSWFPTNRASPNWEACQFLTAPLQTADDTRLTLNNSALEIG